MEAQASQENKKIGYRKMDGTYQSKLGINKKKLDLWFDKTINGMWEGTNPPDHFSAFVDRRENDFSNLLNLTNQLFTLAEANLNKYGLLGDYILLVNINLGYSESIKFWDNSLLSHKSFAEDDFCFYLISDLSVPIFVKGEAYRKTIDLSACGLDSSRCHTYYSCFKSEEAIKNDWQEYNQDICIWRKPLMENL